MGARDHLVAILKCLHCGAHAPTLTDLTTSIPHGYLLGVGDVVQLPLDRPTVGEADARTNYGFSDCFHCSKYFFARTTLIHGVVASVATESIGEPPAERSPCAEFQFSKHALEALASPATNGSVRTIEGEALKRVARAHFEAIVHRWIDHEQHRAASEIAENAENQLQVALLSALRESCFNAVHVHRFLNHPSAELRVAAVDCLRPEDRSHPVTKLFDRDPTVRLAAMGRVRGFTKQPVAELAQLLFDEDPRVVAAVVPLVASVIALRPVFRRFLRHDAFEVRAACVEALSGDSVSSAVFTELLEDQYLIVRQAATRALSDGHTDDASTVVHPVQRLPVGDVDLQRLRAALLSLDADALFDVVLAVASGALPREELEALLRHPVRSVQLAAIHVLGRFENSHPLLSQLLFEDKPLAEAGPLMLRDRRTKALVRAEEYVFDDPIEARATSILNAPVTDASRAPIIAALKDSAWKVRLAAIWALRDDTQSQADLARCIDNSAYPVAVAAIYALAGSVEYFPQLRAALVPDHARLCSAAIRALATDPAAQAAIRELAMHPIPAVREAVAEVLADERDAAQLCRFVFDVDHGVRMQACRSLTQLVSRSSSTLTGIVAPEVLSAIDASFCARLLSNRKSSSSGLEVLKTATISVDGHRVVLSVPGTLQERAAHDGMLSVQNVLDALQDAQRVQSSIVREYWVVSALIPANALSAVLDQRPLQPGEYAIEALLCGLRLPEVSRSEECA